MICIVVARKNSKRLKNKNKMLFGNNTLIEKTIETALKIKQIDDILLSTDDEDIINIAKKYDIICPWKRPAYLSGSKAKTEDVIMHAVKWYEINIRKISNIIIFQPTSPFRNLTLIKKSINKYLNLKSKFPVIGISPEIYLKSKKNLYSIENNYLINKSLNLNRKKYFINGNLYIISKKLLFQTNKIVNFPAIPALNKSIKYSIDIDTIDDFRFALKFIK